MKSFLYFIFGIICMLFAIVAVFNNTFDLYLDDNVIELMHNKYQKEWYWTTMVSSALFILAVLVWVFSLGKSVNELSTEHLIENQYE